MTTSAQTFTFPTPALPGTSVFLCAQWVWGSDPSGGGKAQAACFCCCSCSEEFSSSSLCWSTGVSPMWCSRQAGSRNFEKTSFCYRFFQLISLGIRWRAQGLWFQMKKWWVVKYLSIAVLCRLYDIYYTMLSCKIMLFLIFWNFLKITCIAAFFVWSWHLSLFLWTVQLLPWWKRLLSFLRVARALFTITNHTWREWSVAQNEHQAL